MLQLLPLQEHVRVISQDFLLGHLWLEEAISGDRHVDVEALVWTRYEKIISSNTNVLQRAAGTETTDEEKALLEQLRSFQASLEEFLEIGHHTGSSKALIRTP